MHGILSIPDYPLTQDQIDQYRRDGFIELDDVITGPVLDAMRGPVVNAVAVETNEAPDRPKTGTQATYENIFNQKVNLWQRHPDVARFTLSAALGRIAMRLEGRPMRIQRRSSRHARSPQAIFSAAPD